MPDASELTARMLLQLALILAVCLVMGRLLRRVGLPQVVADMAAGFLLGPPLLGLLAPAVGDWLFPTVLYVAGDPIRHPSMVVLHAIGQLGLVLSMFLVGVRMDRRATVRDARGSLLTSLSGLVVPLLIGGWMGWKLAADTALFPSGTHPYQAALLCGTAMSVTAFPVLARMVCELGLDGRRTGTIVLSAAAVTDGAAWILLAAVLTMSGGSPTAMAVTLVGLVVYAVVLLGPGRRLMERLAHHADEAGQLLLPVTFTLLLGCAFATEELGVHAVFGAFVLGLAMPRGQVAEDLLDRCEPLVSHLLVPVFFVYAGLNVHPDVFRSGAGFGMLALVLFVAFGSKTAPCTLALRMSGFGWRDAATMGVLMNARGLMELVLLDTALQHGLITDGLYTILALMTLLSTVAAPLLARLLRPRPAAAAVHPPWSAPTTAPVTAAADKEGSATW